MRPRGSAPPHSPPPSNVAPPMSYRLQGPRARAAPPPIRTRSPVYRPSPLASPTTLLYDLPQSSSRSPPPQSADALLASPPPKSPVLPSRSTARATPPPRSPAHVVRQELDDFAAHCHAWYFDQDEHAGQLMTQTIEALSASQRPPYARLQASIRAAFHTAMARRRKSELRAHLSSTHPGGSLLPNSRLDPAGRAAKKERLDRFARFLRTWCTSSMPGTRPFFQGLWALLRLQVLPTALGGAGPKRIEWEIDDAVFQESAGKEFMLEAIDVLKGVLAFEEYLPPPSRRHSPAPSDEMEGPARIPHGSPATRPRSPATRPRSPSDPFLDTPALSRSATPSASRSPSRVPLPPSTADESPRHAPARAPGLFAGTDDAEGEPHLRVWTAPDLANPELQRFVALFPDFIRRRSLPRFPPPRTADVEEGLDATGEISCGTGRLWVGDKERREGWAGGFWQRFLQMIRRLLC